MTLFNKYLCEELYNSKYRYRLHVYAVLMEGWDITDERKLFSLYFYGDDDLHAWMDGFVFNNQAVRYYTAADAYTADCLGYGSDKTDIIDLVLGGFMIRSADDPADYQDVDYVLKSECGDIVRLSKVR